MHLGALIAATSFSALLVACEGPRAEPTQHLPVAVAPTMTLYVSNQSFELDPVDIRVTIDGQLAITGDFVVEGQHTWIPFDFDLAPGSHTLRVTSADAGNPLEETFVMDDRKWGVLNFWFYEHRSDPTPAHFSWTLLDEPPAFQ